MVQSSGEHTSSARRLSMCMIFHLDGRSVGAIKGPDRHSENLLRRSILHFIEEVYRLPSLGYADALADDLSDCFDFHRHNAFHKIPAPHDAKYFVNDKSKPEDPDND